MQTVRQWLEQLGLLQYAESFERNAIDLKIAQDLTQQDLLDLGVDALGHRKVLLRAIAELTGPQTSAAKAQSVQVEQPAERSPSPEAERRQLTVMFCDLVGSTELATKLDPEQLRELMQAYQGTCGEVVARYEGHVAQYLGDGLMVYFGWPVAHEDDAVRAIRAGLEVTEAVSRLAMARPISARVGIHTGLVVIGETGAGDASIPKAAVGETPNIAARVQALAEPSCVVVSERTSFLARGLFDYVDLGTHALKGLTEPLRLLRVRAARAIESRFDASRGEVALTPLVGREEEIALLLRRWRQARDGEGQVVLVGGEPGIGKSRLTRALWDGLGREPYLVVRYQCSPYHLHSALYPVIEQFERVAGFAREDSPEQKLDKMRAALAGSEKQIAESAPLFATLLSLPTEQFPALNLSPQKQKERLLEALAGQVEALAQRQPLFVLYEDAHWMDATSQEAMDLLVPRLRDLPVLVIITHRPEYRQRWTDQAHVTTLGLNRLGRRQGAELVAGLTGGKALPPEVLDQILAHTDGVPLFIEELTKSVMESSLLQEGDSAYQLRGSLPPLAIPTTLRDSLIARLDRLAPVRELAQIGACIGREFSYELLAAVAPLKGEQLDETLEQLTKTGLVFRRGTPPDAFYTFKHALVQDAAYDSLLKSKRARLHARIAEVFERDFSDVVASEPELLAHHFTQAGLGERALRYWIDAGQRALARVALAEAVGHLTTALKVNAGLPACSERDRAELDIRLLLGKAYQSLLGWVADEVVQALEPARKLAIRMGEAEKLFQILDYLQAHHVNRCQFAEVMKINAEVDQLARSQNDASWSVIARFDEALTHAMMGNLTQARLALHLMLQAYDSKNQHSFVRTHYNYDPKCLALASAGGWLWALGYPDQGRQAVLDGLELGRRLGHAFNLSFCLNISTIVLVLRGETRLARQWVAEADAIARDHAIRFVTDVIVPTWDGYALIEQGAYGEGYAKLTLGRNLHRDAGGVLQIPGLDTIRARALMSLERHGEARALLEEAVQLIDQTGHRLEEAEVHRVLGELLRRLPAPGGDAAEASFLKALDVARSQEAKGYELRAATSLARLWQDRGRPREAYDLLAPVYHWFTEGLDTRDLVAARELLRALR